MLLLDKAFSDKQLEADVPADLRNISPAVWGRVVSRCRAAEVRLYHVTLQSLDGIEQLTATRRLVLEWVNKVEDLSPVYRMTQLTALGLIDFPKVRYIDGIEALTSLHELHLSGNNGSLTPPLRLTSIAPVAKLPNLTAFTLTNTRLDDDDITVLAKCEGLRSLEIANKFERTQFAYLARHLNGRLQRPIAAYVATNLPCKECGGKKAMFRGRRMPFLCEKCDAARFHRLEDEFASLVAGG